MNQAFTLACRILCSAFLLLSTSDTMQAQVIDTLESGRYYTALAKDAANNIYVTRYNASGPTYEVVKYTNGTGTPVSIYTGLAYSPVDYPWGLAIASNGDVYIAASNVDNKVIKLTYNSTFNSYSAANFLLGNYYSALAIDASNNLYTAEYDGSTHYAVVKYAPGSTTGTTLYGNLHLGGQYPTGLAVASNGDIYVTDGFNSSTGDNGHVYKLTASSGYAVSTISSGKFSTALALDPSGNLYCSEYNGTSTYVLNKYTDGGGSPVTLATLLPDGSFYPWGIVALNSQNIYYSNGSSTANEGGSLLQLINVPQTQATGITFSNTSATGTTASWTRGSGSGCIVFMAQASSGNPVPVNNTTYTANASYSSGTQIGSSGWYCVYKGMGSTVNITGLTAGNTYRVKVLEYNSDGGHEQYNTTTGSNIANVISTPLPVTLISFGGQYRDGKVYLSWETQAETNNKQFRLQWSLTGKDNWSNIGTVATKADQGNSNSPLSYSFVHDKPGKDLNLFRLLQEDLDGKVTISNTVQVMVAADGAAALQLSPNPVRSIFTIAAPFLPGADIYIMNTMGRVVQQEKAKGMEVNVDISALSAGIYWVKTVNGATAHIRKIVKQ